MHRKKILIIAPAWIGDMVIAQTLFKLLKRSLPSCSIDVLANKNLHCLLKYMPEVNRCLELPFAHGELNLYGRYRLAQTLRATKYDQAIILPNSLKSALIPLFAKIPLRTGWRGELRFCLINDLRLLDKNKLPLLAERYAMLALKKDAQLPANWPRPHLVLKKSQSKKIILALCPGAEYGGAKRWPVKYFAEIAKRKSQDDWESWLLGGPKDKVIAAEIQKLSGNSCQDFTGKTTLSEAINLLARAHLVISNDSGLMHIAAALDRPLIAIYGSSSPKFTPPLSKKAKILSLNLPCSPCFKRECPYGHYRCLHDLKPKLIFNEIITLLPTSTKLQYHL